MSLPLMRSQVASSSCITSESCSGVWRDVPNVKLSYASGTHGCLLLATRPIAAGDEIEINYVGEFAPRAVRQADLRMYGFTCSCRKCLSPDDEDDDDEEDEEEEEGGKAEA